ncbi:ATP-dependent DNA helicase RecQ [Catalinimonas alkaloidigena]|uniref:DNA helicase RecQ n=1 Tax=Catalinimonas alkaloidigena TaxID=1075417 RepID=UPI00240560C2|nr:DNA helicase RecQ [Catalinimonas alkaloidigena]MDF9799476.1 ATP-dependent DNA helicase RecQ [Catalinimonas alkaloidigena]
MAADISQLLKTYFGYENFRPQQEEIITHTLNKQDSLIIMPTGGGKSLCYQLPALALDGLTLVISPLIALMQDQVDALKANGIAAAALNSSNTAEEKREIKSQMDEGTLKLLYISPERALTPAFINFIKNRKVSFIAIDEAHCVSIWGNDFRQEYTRLPEMMRHFPHVPFMALTATADRATQTDIAEKLALRNPQKFLSSFERKNLHLQVAPAVQRLHSIKDYVVERKDECGIIYCLSRKSTEKISSALCEVGIKAAYYHAELSGAERNRIQQAFQQDEIKVICATIAFGMGIDKPNIRYVLHFNLPKNIESYYQEIGRAGRDGLAADTILYFSFQDAQILRQFIDDSAADESFKIVQRSKLNRMLEFGQASSCRTNMVLSYFGEHRSEACGHCDNCLNPPEHFDGTVLCQKALSAAKRLNEGVAVNMLVDILRGSERKEIISQGYNQIRTFGAGKDISREDWLSYVGQMINQGVLEIDFTDYNKLKVTHIGEQVLFEGQKIKLSKPSHAPEKKVGKSKTATFEDALFDHLRDVRKNLAKHEDVPAYVIFNDSTLQEMVAERPMYLSDMASISGVGKHKLEKYGEIFLSAIQSFVLKESTPKNIKGKTYLETYSMLKQGHSPEEIGAQRGLNVLTVYSHIAYLYEKGEAVDISAYIRDEEINEIMQAWYKLGKPEVLKDIYIQLEEKYPYYKLRLALSFIKRG